MTTRVVLDAAAFDVLDSPTGTRTRALLEVALAGDGEVCAAAVTLAEVCRGIPRTRRVEATLTRTRGGSRVRIVPTDERLAKVVGAILHDTASGSTDLADAHVVAVCAGAEHAVVVTADPDDIVRLSGAIPGVRVVTRAP